MDFVFKNLGLFVKLYFVFVNGEITQIVWFVNNNPRLYVFNYNYGFTFLQFFGDESVEVVWGDQVVLVNSDKFLFLPFLIFGIYFLFDFFNCFKFCLLLKLRFFFIIFNFSFNFFNISQFFLFYFTLSIFCVVSSLKIKLEQFFFMLFAFLFFFSLKFFIGFHDLNVLILKLLISLLINQFLLFNNHIAFGFPFFIFLFE